MVNEGRWVKIIIKNKMERGDDFNWGHSLNDSQEIIVFTSSDEESQAADPTYAFLPLVILRKLQLV